MKRYNNLLEDTLPQRYEQDIKKYRYKVHFNFFIIVSLIILIIWAVYSYEKALSQKVNDSNKDIVTTELTEKTIEQHIGEAILYPAKEINDSILYAYLEEINAWYPDILLAQAKIESASYTSTVFKKANNLYGMKQVYSRFHCQTSSFNSYGGYDSWKLSVLDRVLYDLFVFDSIKPERDIYLKQLRNYAESQNYIEIINKVINSNAAKNETENPENTN